MVLHRVGKSRLIVVPKENNTGSFRLWEWQRSQYHYCTSVIPWVPDPMPSKTWTQCIASMLISHTQAPKASEFTKFGRDEQWVSEQKENSRNDSSLPCSLLCLQHLGQHPTENRNSVHLSRISKVNNFKWNLIAIKWGD